MSRRSHGTTIGARPALPADWDRREAISGLLVAGFLRAEESPGTFALLARDDRDAARNARGYVAYYETQLVETDLPERRGAIARALGEQRALLAYHAARYRQWRRAERQANRRVDTLLAASQRPAEHTIPTSVPTLAPSCSAGHSGAADGGDHR